jgi:hypothetical protein
MAMQGSAGDNASWALYMKIIGWTTTTQTIASIVSLKPQNSDVIAKMYILSFDALLSLKYA